MVSTLISLTVFVLLFGLVFGEEQSENAATTHQSSHQTRELRTIFCRCVADFETFYENDRRRQLKSYFEYDGTFPAVTATSKDKRKSLRDKASKYYNEDFTSKTSRQGTSEAIEGPDGFFIVDGITVLPLDDEACIVSQTNSALRSFLELLFRPRAESNDRSKGIASFSNLFQNRNRRALISDENQNENEDEVNERALQGWGDRRNNKAFVIKLYKAYWIRICESKYQIV